MMQLNYVGRNIEVTQALKTHTADKFKSIEKRFQQVGQVHVTFHVENVTHIAEATLHLDGTTLHASAKEDDMYKAIDALVDKLLGQLVKHKEKIIDDHR